MESATVEACKVQLEGEARVGDVEESSKCYLMTGMFHETHSLNKYFSLAIHT